MVPTGHLERIELQRAEAVDDGHHAGRLGRKRTRRSEEVADGQEATRGRPAHVNRLGHPTDGIRRPVRSCQVRRPMTRRARPARTMRSRCKLFGRTVCSGIDQIIR